EVDVIGMPGTVGMVQRLADRLDDTRLIHGCGLLGEGGTITPCGPQSTGAAGVGAVPAALLGIAPVSGPVPRRAQRPTMSAHPRLEGQPLRLAGRAATGAH